MARRALLDQFQLPNAGYIGCTVTFYTASALGVATATKATLYDDLTGTGTLANPQTFDSDGKLPQPTYIEVAVVPVVAGAHVVSQTLGVVCPPGGARGDWATATLYLPGDIITDGAAGTGTGDIYAVVNFHQSGVWATDSANSSKLKKVLDISDLTNQVVPDASETVKGKAELATIAEVRAAADTTRIVTPDGLASLWQEGVPIVSAASIAKPSDVNLGGYYTQSGNTTTNSYWAGVVGGEPMEIRYTGTPTLSVAGNLLPPGAAAYAVTTGTILRWRWDAGLSKWRCVGGMKSDGSAVAVVVVATFSAHKNGTSQASITSATATKLTFTTEVEDIGSYYDAANSKWTPPAGVVQINAAAFFANVNIVDQAIYFVAIYKNGAVLKCGIQPTASGTGGIGAAVSCRDRANGTDYYEVYCFGGGAGAKTVDGTSSNTWFDGFWVGP